MPLCRSLIKDFLEREQPDSRIAIGVQTLFRGRETGDAFSRVAGKERLQALVRCSKQLIIVSANIERVHGCKFSDLELDEQVHKR